MKLRELLCECVRVKAASINQLIYTLCCLFFLVPGMSLYRAGNVCVSLCRFVCLRRRGAEIALHIRHPKGITVMQKICEINEMILINSNILRTGIEVEVAKI